MGNEASYPVPSELPLSARHNVLKGGRPNLTSIAELIKSGSARNIVVMTGAGLSVAAGIPDFRTPGTDELGLPCPEAVFHIEFFRHNPKPFYLLAKRLFPGNFHPTDAHFFSVLLEKKGLLLRHYTQNIDNLEVLAGVPSEKLVEAHGSFGDVHCIRCHHQYPLGWFRKQIFHYKTVARCTGPPINGIEPDYQEYSKRPRVLTGISLSEELRDGESEEAREQEERSHLNNYTELKPESEMEADQLSSELEKMTLEESSKESLETTLDDHHTPHTATSDSPRYCEREVHVSHTRLTQSEPTTNAHPAPPSHFSILSALSPEVQEDNLEINPPSDRSSTTFQNDNNYSEEEENNSHLCYSSIPRSSRTSGPTILDDCNNTPNKATVCNGLIKPDITFFGENLPKRFGMLTPVDLPQADLLIVMGTSLQVYPFSGLVEMVNPFCARLLINREPVGLSRNGGSDGRFLFHDSDNYRDVIFEGDCDDGVHELCRLLEWEDELKLLKLEYDKKPEKDHWKLLEQRQLIEPHLVSENEEHNNSSRRGRVESKY